MTDPSLIDRENWEEHYVKRGDPKKATHYIIRFNAPLTGLFWHFSSVAGHIRYALQNGWLPVVDLQNYPNASLRPKNSARKILGNIISNNR